MVREGFHQGVQGQADARVKTRSLVLLAFGEAKRSVLEDAAEGRGGYPVQALLGQVQTPVRIAWAP